MASIRDFLSGIFWKIDPLSQAGRVTLYDINGDALTGTEDTTIPVSLSLLSDTEEIDLSGHNTVGFSLLSIGHANNVITAEVSIDSIWIAVPVVDITTSNSTATVTVAGSYTISLWGGSTKFRLRMSSYTSGTATGTISAVYQVPSHLNIRSYDNVLSTVNSTTTQLNAGATFTGAWEADLFWQGITCNIFADQPLTVTVQQSMNGTTVHKSDTWYYNPNSTGRDATKSINLISNYHRFIVTNTGAAPTTTFSLQGYACPNFTAMPVSQTIGGGMPVEPPDLDTYTAVFSGTPVGTATFTIRGSATRTVRVIDFGFSTTTTGTNQFITVSIKKYSAISTGTPATPTMVPSDSISPAATALVQNWSVTPGTQTAVGTMIAQRYLASKTTVDIQPQLFNPVFGNHTRGTSGLILRGTSQWAGLDLSAAPTGAVADMWVRWVEY